MQISKLLTFSVCAATGFALNVPGLPTLPALPATSSLPVVGSGLPNLPSTSSLPAVGSIAGNLPVPAALPSGLPTDPAALLGNVAEVIQILQVVTALLNNVPIPGLGAIGVGSALIPTLLNTAQGLLKVPGV